MPGQISGGVSRTHRLGNQAEIEAAEAALQARTVQGMRRPLPPPAPLPEQFRPEPQVAHSDEQAVSLLLGAAPPTDDAPAPLEGQYRVEYSEESVYVTLAYGKREFVGSGASLTEALGIAAGELEDGLAQPVCPHCGQVMPEAEE